MSARTLHRRFGMGLLTGALTLGLAACSLAPQYVRPDAPIPVAFPTFRQSSASAGGQAGDAAPPAADLGWHDFFRDPQLVALIALALENNRDMRIAVERVQEARALFGIAQSDRYPTLGAGVMGQITRNPSEMRAPGSGSVSRGYQAGLGMTAFELDFFGRVRNLSEAAYQQYLGTQQAQRTVQLNLVAQVAEAYFNLRLSEQMADLMSRTLTARQNTYDLIAQQFEAGVASDLDVQQALGQLETVRADQAAIARAHAQAGHALQWLLGIPLPDDLPAAMTFGRDQLIEHIPAGLPSDLLTRRPDVLAAEHGLRAANANIGAARAAFFPNISITGLLGMASPQLSDLLGAGGFWQFSPQLQTPLFSGGVSGNLALAEARKHIAVSQYEQTIQTAFREVADALAGESTYAQQLAALRDLLRSSVDALRLAKLRYETGIDSFLQVQTAEVNLYAVQQSLLTVGMNALLNRVSLYKALGGGWHDHTVDAALDSATIAGSAVVAATAEPAPGAVVRSGAGPVAAAPLGSQSLTHEAP